MLQKCAMCLVDAFQVRTGGCSLLCLRAAVRFLNELDEGCTLSVYIDKVFYHRVVGRFAGAAIPENEDWFFVERRSGVLTNQVPVRLIRATGPWNIDGAGASWCLPVLLEEKRSAFLHEGKIVMHDDAFNGKDPNLEGV